MFGDAILARAQIAAAHSRDLEFAVVKFVEAKVEVHLCGNFF
jgi:hypothetical protein